ncbi:uncharacterized protein LOC130739514 [Lotus japonicus]|uniref:uncharacterized protein LOC130739514 n=1 Tax=Lotus japonicus TaxID=34305 RepID=UPI00258A8C86|nr:uncharacterized protein LOC130739514 [Lotus japonicus]
MEAQPTPPPIYPDSTNSSPRSRNTDSWDDPYPSPAATTTKLRLMCSYGGHIVPRPHDKSLCYVGGDTRILVVDRTTSLSDLSARLSKTLLKGRPFVLKYQLPNEDLDSLVSVTTDEDLENMIDEYLNRNPSRIRLFLFEAAPGTPKSEEWFMSALSRGMPDSASVNSLLGLDDDAAAAPAHGKNSKQEVQSVPDSPMLGTNSSFGSSSSSPSAVNLPQIKVRVEEGGSGGGGGVNRVQDQKGVGIEEQFAQLGVGGARQKPGEGFAALSSPPAAVAAVVSDEERSEHGVPVGHRQPQQQVQTQTTQTQVQSQSQGQVPQFQQNSTGFVDLTSPNSVASDNSFVNAMPFLKPVIYQDQVHIQSGTSRVHTPPPVDPNLSDRIQIHQQHVHDPGFVLQQQQFDQQRLFDHQQQQAKQQFDHQQQQAQQQQQQFDQQQLFDHQQQQAQQQQQFMQGSRVIQQTPAYYPVYQQQQVHPQHHHLVDQQYQVYYVPARQAQAYNLPAQHANVGESATNISPSAAPSSAAYNPLRNAPLPQFVQIPTGQHQQPQQQYVAYSQIHHPSQFMTPNSAPPSNYVYDFADPAYAQMLYTQPLAPPSQHTNRP